ncbi:hypothetical protein, partial [Klebsiella pneumoniae]|uniref:hypothetical protein n=1 Tax=Klebsiella pneumoniae TaxID=573 RepID=UPI003F572351
CVEQDDKGWDARKRAYCLKIQPATGSFARNLIYSTKPSFSHPQCKKTLTGLSFPPQTLALRLILPVNIRYQELSYHSISHSQK